MIPERDATEITPDPFRRPTEADEWNKVRHIHRTDIRHLPDDIAIETYVRALQAHDWFYMMSDSSAVYREGKSSYDRLLSLATRQANLNRDLRYKDLFDAFNAWCYDAISNPDDESGRPYPDDTVVATILDSHAKETDR